MPFDALVAPPRQNALSDALETHRIAPVSWAALVDHKLAQQEKYGPSFWFRHQTKISIALIGTSPVVGTVVGALQGFSPHSSALAVASSFMWMCLVAMLTGTGLVKLRAGASWQERSVNAYELEELRVPRQIATVARSIQRMVPDSDIVLGELKRHEAVLDPYLVLEHRDQRICLGIWEDDKVIAVPTPR
jgi:hypothetical protein